MNMNANYFFIIYILDVINLSRNGKKIYYLPTSCNKDIGMEYILVTTRENDKVRFLRIFKTKSFMSVNISVMIPVDPWNGMLGIGLMPLLTLPVCL